MLKITFEITETRRADLAVLHALQSQAGQANLSRRSLKILFEAGQINVDGRRPSPSDVLPPGPHLLEVEEAALDRISKASGARPAENTGDLKVDIVYEDEVLLVLHKPSGMPSVPHSSAETETAVGFALARVPGISAIGPRGAESGLEPGILHRLDTGTSGLLVFAKTQPEFDRLRALWKGGKIRKTYRALSRPDAIQAPTPLPPRGLLIDVPLAHDTKSDKRMIVVRPGDRHFRGEPLPARTRILDIQGDGPVDFFVEIETGVMHQIRCHLASIGWPIQGDPVYGGVPSRRLGLHAWRLALPHASGTELVLESRLPESWPKLFTR